MLISILSLSETGDGVGGGVGGGVETGEEFSSTMQ